MVLHYEDTNWRQLLTQGFDALAVTGLLVGGNGADGHFAHPKRRPPSTAVIKVAHVI